jgi:hypothetical protein
MVRRFKAENPGYWFFHCHMSWHDHIGMGFVIKIGIVHIFFMNLHKPNATTTKV